MLLEELFIIYKCLFRLNLSVSLYCFYIFILKLYALLYLYVHCKLQNQESCVCQPRIQLPFICTLMN